MFIVNTFLTAASILAICKKHLVPFTAKKKLDHQLSINVSIILHLVVSRITHSHKYEWSTMRIAPAFEIDHPDRLTPKSLSGRWSQWGRFYNKLDLTNHSGVTNSWILLIVFTKKQLNVSLIKIEMYLINVLCSANY